MLNSQSPRNDYLTQSDEHFILDCIQDFYKSTGNGGQKKNKTSSSVRLIHKPTGLSATSGDRRSQKENKTLALRRLRLNLAFSLREPFTFSTELQLNMNEKNPQFPMLVALLIDALQQTEWKVSETAQLIQSTTGQLIKCLKKHPTLWQFVNQQRQKVALTPLK